MQGKRESSTSYSTHSSSSSRSVRRNNTKSQLATSNLAIEGTSSRQSINDKSRMLHSHDNAPILLSVYDDKHSRLIERNPLLHSNRVHIPWYRRYTEYVPEKEQLSFQPFKEIQTRDEDIALQHQFGYHECMVEHNHKGASRLPALECKRIREFSMSRYQRIKKRETEKIEQQWKQEPKPKPATHDELTSGGHEPDFTMEFGFSINKKKIVLPVVEFLTKLHLNRARLVSRRPLVEGSKWRTLHKQKTIEYIKDATVIMKRQYARNRIQRLFNLVLCVDRFIKCVAMIAGDTQTLLKDTTFIPKKKSAVHGADERPDKEIVFFNITNYQKVGQVQIPFQLQLILSKPWFCRSNKDVERAVNFLEKMRCFTAYPRQFQFMLARVAWYLELPTQKVIIRQGQQAVNFYLLLNGQVRLDRLEGSGYEEDIETVYKTLNTLSSQDMFGDECITDPFAERQYTATSEEKCAVLDFNMHDYNNMIQTANLSEEAPDHIRFLCKLRIMDNFPKIKLLQEQENNVTYFFFRPETLVCRSVKDSPYVFVIRNGSCSILREIVPEWRPAPSKVKSGRESFVVAMLEETRDLKEMHMVGRSSKVLSPRSTLGAIQPYSRKASSIFENLRTKLSHQDMRMFDKTQMEYETEKQRMSAQTKDLQRRSMVLLSNTTLSTRSSTQSRLSTRSSMKPDSILEGKARSPKGSRDNSRSSLRWQVDNKRETNEEWGFGESQSKNSSRASASSSRSHNEDRRGIKIPGTNMTFKEDKFMKHLSTSLDIAVKRRESDKSNSSSANDAVSNFSGNNENVERKFMSMNETVTESKKRVRLSENQDEDPNLNNSKVPSKQTAIGKTCGGALKKTPQVNSTSDDTNNNEKKESPKKKHTVTFLDEQDKQPSTKSTSSILKQRNVSATTNLARKPHDLRIRALPDIIRNFAGGSSKSDINSNKATTNQETKIPIAAATTKASHFGSKAVPKLSKIPIPRSSEESSEPKDFSNNRESISINTTKRVRTSQQKTTDSPKRQSRNNSGESYLIDMPTVKPCAYSQWAREAILTVTDVVGVEFLDYNDGNYKEPSGDISLVSHGATVIMIKKEFMLKYLRKVW